MKKIKELEFFINKEILRTGFNFLYAAIFIIIFAILGMVMECWFIKFSNNAPTDILIKDIIVQLLLDLFVIYFIVRLFQLGGKKLFGVSYLSSNILAEIGMGFIFFETQHNMKLKIAEISTRLEKVFCL